MNNLPDALIVRILDHLNVDELINKMKMVCKRWKNLIENNLKIKELIIRDEYEEIFDWYFDCEPINLKNTIYSSKLDFFSYPSFTAMFKNDLKKLKTNLKRNINLEYLNDLTRIEHLEIDDCLYLDRSVTLNLKNLKILKIFIFLKDHKLIINSLNLKILSCFKLQTIKILKPQKVEYIEVKKNLVECLKMFSNLKVFKCNSIEYLNMNILYRLPANLDRLHLYTDNRSAQNHLFCKEIIAEILKQKLILRRNLRIFFQGVLLDDLVFKLNDYDFTKMLDAFREKDALKLFYDNYDDNLEDKLSWYNDIDYNELMFTFENHLPYSFFSKFNRIEQVSACGLVSKKEFTWFISNCPNLKFLFIKNSSLDQEFYSNLPSTCNLLMNFYLQENDCFELDYEFALKFELLKEFKVSLHLPWCFVRKILTKLKFIHYLGFMNRKSNSIKKLNQYKYKFRYDQRWSILDLDELIEVIDELERDSVL